LVKSEVERGSQFPALAKKIKMHPFVLRKTFDQSKNFSFQALKNIYEKLAQTDMAVKSGRLESRAALDLLVAEIAG
jgi:DNA polymerase-3 subunit delta